MYTIRKKLFFLLVELMMLHWFSSCMSDRKNGRIELSSKIINRSDSIYVGNKYRSGYIVETKLCNTTNSVFQFWAMSNSLDFSLEETKDLFFVWPDSYASYPVVFSINSNDCLKWESKLLLSDSIQRSNAGILKIIFYFINANKLDAKDLDLLEVFRSGDCDSLEGTLSNPDFYDYSK